VSNFKDKFGSHKQNVAAKQSAHRRTMQNINAYACPKTPKNHKTSAMQADIDRCDAKSVYALQKASDR